MPGGRGSMGPQELATPLQLWRHLYLQQVEEGRKDGVAGSAVTDPHLPLSSFFSPFVICTQHRKMVAGAKR